MQITDTIADMLTRIRNANSAKHDSVDIPASNMKKAIAQILVDEGYVLSLIHISVVKPGRVMFEIAGVSEEDAREAMRLAANKLPIKCKFVSKETDGEQV